jgi:hypothetical protein
MGSDYLISASETTRHGQLAITNAPLIDQLGHQGPSTLASAGPIKQGGGEIGRRYDQRW